MSSSFSNKTLVIVFVVLLVAAGIYFLAGGKGEDRTFTSHLAAEIDTAAVDEILLYPASEQHSEVRLFKEDGGWKVNLDSEQTTAVDQKKINIIFETLEALRPRRLVARSEEHWAKYDVDDTGTRVKVLEDGDITADVVIGRFQFQQPRTMLSYVRLQDDATVYEVEGYLDAVFNRGVNNFRDNTVLQDNHLLWSSVEFDYPGDSSFAMEKRGFQWYLNGEPTDSVMTFQELRRIARLSSQDFVDYPAEGVIDGQPEYKVTVERAEGEPIVVEAYEDGANLYIHSSLNPTAWFDGNKGKLRETLFTSPEKFFK